MNPHAALARTRKVFALLRAIDIIATDRDPEAVLRWLETLPEAAPAGEPSWAALCLVAGTRRPSEETREQVRAELRARGQRRAS